MTTAAMKALSLWVGVGVWDGGGGVEVGEAVVMDVLGVGVCAGGFGRLV